MSVEREVNTVALERLSALVDGELVGDATAQACAHWRESGSSRASWHAYQLIGDVLRSDDLATDPARDAAFLMALRLRLADEPVVLAPQPLTSSVSALAVGSRGALPMQAAASGRSGRSGWLVPSAVAAGFVLVAGALMVARTPDALPGRAQGVPLASAASAAGETGATRELDVRVGGAAADATADTHTQASTANGALLRDVRLDRYLAAHKQFAGTSALGVPSAFLRSATVSSSDR